MDIETILAAQRGDTDAVTAVITAMDRRVRALARRADRNLAEDLAQVGRMAVWECIRRFDGTTADRFAAYAWTSAKGAMSNARRELAYQGVTPDVMKLFESALRRTGGDVTAAERLVCSAEMEPWRLLPDTARAARMAHQGAVPLPMGSAGPERSEGPTTRSEATRRRVGYSLAMLSTRQRAVLKATYGISGNGAADDAETGQTLKLTHAQIASARHKARNRFAEVHASWLDVPA